MSDEARERAVMFPEAAPSLVGIHTRAIRLRTQSPAIVLLNAGLLPRTGPNRLYVTLAREMAAIGFDSLRFDGSGIGDSTPRSSGESYRQSALRDVADALAFLAKEGGYTSFILVGLCSGADLAVRAALADERIVGLVLLDGLPYSNVRSRVNDELLRVARAMADGRWRKLVLRGGVIRKALGRVVTTNAKKTARPSAMVVEGRRDVPPLDEARATLAALARRKVTILAVFTEGRGYNYPGQFSDLFPHLDRDAVSVIQIAGADHTFSLCATQDSVIAVVRNWIMPTSQPARVLDMRKPDAGRGSSRVDDLRLRSKA